MCMMHSVGAFLWDDLDQGQWYEITQIKVHRMNWWILSKGGFIKFLWRAMIRVITDYWSWCGAFQWNTPGESYSSVCEICLETGIREYTVHRTSYFPQIESDYSKAWCKSSIIFYMQHLHLYIQFVTGKAEQVAPLSAPFRMSLPIGIQIRVQRKSFLQLAR